jgi:hypothetical protein
MTNEELQNAVFYEVGTQHGLIKVLRIEEVVEAVEGRLATRTWKMGSKFPVRLFADAGALPTEKELVAMGKRWEARKRVMAAIGWCLVNGLDVQLNDEELPVWRSTVTRFLRDTDTSEREYELRSWRQRRSELQQEV